MKYNYITIEREYGSGGTKIAKGLAEKCQIPCYGREILETVAQKRNISVEAIEQYEEKATNSFLYTIFVMNRIQSGDADMLPEEGHIYLEEQKEILRVSKAGPAIFLGHCAAEALRDEKGVAKVFIFADDKYKKKRILEDYGIEQSKAEETKKYYDRKRSKYYQAYTQKKWNDPKNYDIVLNSGSLGVEGCIKVLEGLLV